MRGLSHKTISGWQIFAGGLSASGPIIVLFGGIPATFAATELLDTPAAFLVVTVVLVLLLLTFVSAGRRTRHAAPAYAIISQGFNGVLGLGAASIALLCYSTIGTSIYGLLGSTISGFFGGPWWLWALLGWGLVSTVSMSKPTFSGKVIIAPLLLQLAVAAYLIYVGLRHPATGSLTAAGFHLPSLFNHGGGLLFTVAAFIGFEIVAIFVEEAKRPQLIRNVMLTVVTFGGLLYTLIAWSMVQGAGPDNVIAAAQMQALPGSLLGSMMGVALVVFVLGMLTCSLAFHNCAARYVYALAREGAFPKGLATVRNEAPLGGSLSQSLISLALIVLGAVWGLDPFTQFFTWLSGLAAFGVLLLLSACAAAAVRFFYLGKGQSEGWFVRRGAPIAGSVLGVGMLAIMLVNLNTLLGTDSWLKAMIVPGVVLGFGLLGIVWGAIVRQAQPEVYRRIGAGAEHPYTYANRHLLGVRV